MHYFIADISSVPLRHVSWYQTEQVCNLQQLHWHSKALYCANCISLLWSSLDGCRQAVGGMQVAWEHGVTIDDQMKWEFKGSPPGAVEKVAPPTINTALTD